MCVVCVFAMNANFNHYRSLHFGHFDLPKRYLKTYQRHRMRSAYQFGQVCLLEQIRYDIVLIGGPVLSRPISTDFCDISWVGIVCVCHG